MISSGHLVFFTSGYFKTSFIARASVHVRARARVIISRHESMRVDFLFQRSVFLLLLVFFSLKKIISAWSNVARILISSRMDLHGLILNT